MAILSVVCGGGQCCGGWMREGQVWIILEYDNAFSELPYAGVVFNFSFPLDKLKQAGNRVNYFLYLLETNQIDLPLHL